MLKALGVSIIPASAPDFFTEDTPTAVQVRQVLGAIAQFEKATACETGSGSQAQAGAEGRCEGRNPLSETRPAVVTLARKLRRRRPKGGQLSLRGVSKALATEAVATSVASPTPPNRWPACGLMAHLSCNRYSQKVL